MGYLEQSLGSPIRYDPALARVRGQYHLNTLPLDTDYHIKSETAIYYLQANLEEAVQGPESFEQLLISYSYKSAYAEGIPYTLNIRRERKVTIPGPIYDYLQLLADRLRSDAQGSRRNIYTPTRDKEIYIDIDPLAKRIEDMRSLVEETLSTGGIHTAIQTLYRMERSWFWSRGNHSRSMNFFNVLLEKIGYQPIPHGVIDFAAFTLNEEDFQRYMVFIFRDVERQKI